MPVAEWHCINLPWLLGQHDNSKKNPICCFDDQGTKESAVTAPVAKISKVQNRLLKVCYEPATSASLPRVSFFFSFLFFVAAAIDSTNEANEVPLSNLLFLDVYAP